MRLSLRLLLTVLSLAAVAAGRTPPPSGPEATPSEKAHPHTQAPSSPPILKASEDTPARRAHPPTKHKQVASAASLQPASQSLTETPTETGKEKENAYVDAGNREGKGEHGERGAAGPNGQTGLGPPLSGHDLAAFLSHGIDAVGSDPRRNPDGVMYAVHLASKAEKTAANVVGDVVQQIQNKGGESYQKIKKEVSSDFTNVQQGIANAGGGDNEQKTEKGTPPLPTGVVGEGVGAVVGVQSVKAAGRTGEDGVNVIRLIRVLAGFATLATMCLSLLHILRHLHSWREPQYQKYVARILLLVPIFVLMSWFGMMLPDERDFFQLLRDSYEAFSLYSFLVLMIHYLGGERRLFLNLEAQGRVQWPWPLQSLRPFQPTPRLFQMIRLGCLQFVFIMPLCSFVAFFFRCLGAYTDGSFSPDDAYLWLWMLQSASISVSMNALVFFYLVTQDLIQPFQPLLKFVCIKFVVVVPYWQNFIFMGLAWWGVIGEYRNFSGQQVSADVQDIIATQSAEDGAFSLQGVFGSRTPSLPSSRRPETKLQRTNSRGDKKEDTDSDRRIEERENGGLRNKAKFTLCDHPAGLSSPTSDGSSSLFSGRVSTSSSLAHSDLLSVSRKMHEAPTQTRSAGSDSDTDSVTAGGEGEDVLQSLRVSSRDGGGMSRQLPSGRCKSGNADLDLNLCVRQQPAEGDGSLSYSDSLSFSSAAAAAYSSGKAFLMGGTSLMGAQANQQQQEQQEYATSSMRDLTFAVSSSGEEEGSEEEFED
uniref:Transmembrane protein n=1 Tax=Chromera velia CCMP2878 TaxID=1169474 RepID=A0A0G4GZI5_9ALVE|eukprot:Cvel_5444.t1-p1 / transcript=Cvel_5444.t1 / gene=Cvel_5444 / organism=Chromera_velia_CCMP2878 / gene_product=Transmembrane protein 184 homolog DDB_G0279555, putative / transcript_product=Transmembrane protein 184 homolog DDB_G0279555, putative / location=Cvel_scaffold254:47838-53616(+) / protein_length=758 / sequence_SO=supercontig / SO=protein_coding / is_pseudo=false